MMVRRNFPSLNALLVLEAAVRHRSFTSAAVELGVTQAAVSRQVALLEEQLGVELFQRLHRQIEPTSECRQLAATLSTSFAQIGDGIEALRAAHQQEVVTIGATLAFSTFWLLPRIGEVRRRYPSLQIRVLSQDNRIPLGADGIDVVVRYEVDSSDDGVVVASCGDVVFPVCSPAHAQRLAATTPIMPVTLEDLNLIEQDVPDPAWYQWGEWFRRAGVTARIRQPALRFNHYTEVLQAAKDGHGVALGWQVLVQGLLDEGSLVRLGDASVTADGRYSVIVPKRRKSSPMRDALVDWLSESLGQSPGP